MTPRYSYLDHAATTAVRPEVLDAMMPFLTPPGVGNPSSLHRAGRAARASVEQARHTVASVCGVEPRHVIFTSGGTEADNLAVVGAAFAARARGRPFRVAISAVEHKAVLDAAGYVERLGGERIVLPIDPTGVVDQDALDAALTRGVALVSVMWVNNEVGLVQPVAELAQRCAQAEVPFHTDAVQAIGKLPVSIQGTGIGLLSLSGHKIGAPQGIGALIVRERRMLAPLLHGGGQQLGLRPGTENVPGIVAFAKAVELAASEQSELAPRLGTLRDELERRLTDALADVVIHGRQGERAPHISAVSVPGTSSESLLMHLDLAGIACSAGSACHSGSTEGSHVLAALRVPPELAGGMLRFSFGRESTTEDVDAVIRALPGVVSRVRTLATVLAR